MGIKSPRELALKMVEDEWNHSRGRHDKIQRIRNALEHAAAESTHSVLTRRKLVPEERKRDLKHESTGEDQHPAKKAR